MKKIKKKILTQLFDNNIKIKIFEKNPKKGGIPAEDNKEIIKNLVSVEL